MNSLSIYLLTYNTPQQFRLWCEHFAVFSAGFYDEMHKFVINNSDNPSLQDEYNLLFLEFGFTVISEAKNWGINGGRYYASMHFHETNQKFMIFFEDDMLLRSASNIICKSGFKTYHPTLFQDAISIVEQESLGFLKLCFSEVYNTNHENIALQSLNEQDHIEILKADPNGFFLSANVCIDYTDVYNNLAYSVGAYSYCNWPLLFTQHANKLVFIDYPLESKFEMAYTRRAYFLILMSQLRVGCLLASPIKHLRQYVYDPIDRIENEQGLRIDGVKICLDSN